MYAGDAENLLRMITMGVGMNHRTTASSECRPCAAVQLDDEKQERERKKDDAGTRSVTAGQKEGERSEESSWFSRHTVGANGYATLRPLRFATGGLTTLERREMMKNKCLYCNRTITTKRYIFIATYVKNKAGVYNTNTIGALHPRCMDKIAKEALERRNES